jgi:hypothetical protein
MEFLILGGLILTMDLIKKVNKKLKDSIKALSGLKIPIGIVVILTSLGFWGAHGAGGTLQGIVGIAAGSVLTLDLIKLIPTKKETEKQIDDLMTIITVPVGIAAIIVGVIGLFYK